MGMLKSRDHVEHTRMFYHGATAIRRKIVATPKRLVDLSDDLIARAGESLGTAGDNLRTIDESVRRYLPKVTKRLQAAGHVERPTGRRKQRAISDWTWDALARAEKDQVPLDMIALLRCCMTMASRGEAPNDPPN